MSDTPEKATMVITRADGRERKNVDVYVADTVGANARFDNGSGVASASSADFFVMPFDGYITDFSIATGTASTTAGQFTVNGLGIGTTVRWANYLNSLNSRPALAVPVRAGSYVRIIQLA
jgi:hypothetical protein